MWVNLHGGECEPVCSAVSPGHGDRRRLCHTLLRNIQRRSAGCRHPGSGLRDEVSLRLPTRTVIRSSTEMSVTPCWLLEGVLWCWGCIVQAFQSSAILWLSAPIYCKMGSFCVLLLRLSSCVFFQSSKHFCSMSSQHTCLSFVKIFCFLPLFCSTFGSRANLRFLQVQISICLKFQTKNLQIQWLSKQLQLNDLVWIRPAEQQLCHSS